MVHAYGPGDLYTVSYSDGELSVMCRFGPTAVCAGDTVEAAYCVDDLEVLLTGVCTMVRDGEVSFDSSVMCTYLPWSNFRSVWDWWSVTIGSPTDCGNFPVLVLVCRMAEADGAVGETESVRCVILLCEDLRRSVR